MLSKIIVKNLIKLVTLIVPIRKIINSKVYIFFDISYFDIIQAIGIRKKWKKLNTKVTGLALATTSGILYIICAIWFWLSAKTALLYFDSLFHGIEVSAIAEQSLTFSGVIIGLMLIVISAYVIGALFAMLYNYFSTK